MANPGVPARIVESGGERQGGHSLSVDHGLLVPALGSHGLERQRHLAQEVVGDERLAVPDLDPQRGAAPLGDVHGQHVVLDSVRRRSNKSCLAVGPREVADMRGKRSINDIMP